MDEQKAEDVCGVTQSTSQGRGEVLLTLPWFCRSCTHVHCKRKEIHGYPCRQKLIVAWTSRKQLVLVLMYSNFKNESKKTLI